MSWRDRDYSNGSFGESTATAWGLRRPPTATLTLMIVHGAAFVLMRMLPTGEGQDVPAWLALQGGAGALIGIVSHPFATTSLISALFVVLALWSLGGRLEPRLGVRRFLAVYVAGNVVAGAAYFAVAQVHASLAAAPLDSPVGALAGLCVLTWRQLRYEAVQVFGRVTTVGRVYAVGAAIVVLLAVVASGLGAGAWLAAVAAGGFAALLIEQGLTRRATRPRPVRRVVRPSVPQPVIPPSPPDEPDIDNLLAKISREGLESLTDAERRRLEAARQAKLRRSS